MPGGRSWPHLMAKPCGVAFLRLNIGYGPGEMHLPNDASCGVSGGTNWSASSVGESVSS